MLLDNNQNIYFNDSGGTTRQVLSLTSGNNVLLTNYAAGDIQMGTGTANGRIELYTGSSVERLRIDQFGNIGINTQSPAAILDVRGVGTNAMNGTTPVASISGKTSFATEVVDNSGVGDIWTASSSGLSRFVITNSGNVGYWDNVPRETARQLGRFAVPIGHE